MGVCSSCLRGSTTIGNPSAFTEELETRRRRQMEAAEKRRQENEKRGIRDLEKLRRQQQRQLEIERRQEEAINQNNQSANLKWQTNT